MRADQFDQTRQDGGLAGWVLAVTLTVTLSDGLDVCRSACHFTSLPLRLPSNSWTLLLVRGWAAATRRRLSDADQQNRQDAGGYKKRNIVGCGSRMILSNQSIIESWMASSQVLWESRYQEGVVGRFWARKKRGGGLWMDNQSSASSSSSSSKCQLKPVCLCLTINPRPRLGGDGLGGDRLDDSSLVWSGLIWSGTGDWTCPIYT